MVASLDRLPKHIGEVINSSLNEIKSKGLECPEGCGYNHIFAYKIKLNSYSVPGTYITWANDNCTFKWGWHFVPHENMNWQADDWYHNQTAYMSFEDVDDALQAALELNLVT